MKLEDALFNWLQIKYVAEQRPQDQAAQETYQFFSQILKEDHQLEEIEVSVEKGMYLVQYSKHGKREAQRYPKEFVHQLLIDIEAEPKFNQ